MYRGRYRARTAGSVWAIAVTTAILDRVTTAPYSAHAVRKLRASYAGNAFRVRRTSDNAEQDIGFSADGRLDTSALLVFCSATNGFITTWYDQTGNGRHLIQPDTTKQPQIVSAGTVLRQDNNPALVFAIGQWMYANDGGVVFAQPYSRSTVFQIDTRSAGANIAGGFNATDGRLVQSAANSLSMNAGTDVVINSGTGTGANGQYTIAELYSSSSSTRSVNGQVATIDVGTGAGSSLILNANRTLGSELVTNGTFNTDISGWGVAPAFPSESVTWSSGAIRMESITGTYAESVSPAISLTIGQTYLLELEVLAGSSANYWVLLSDSATSDNSNRVTFVGGSASAGYQKLRFQFTASYATAYLYLATANALGSVMLVDNVSIKSLTIASNSAIRMTEAIMWNTALDATSRQTLTLNQRQFYTTP